MELNLVLTWDEYNDKDENLAVLRFPVSSNGVKNGNGENKDEAESSEDDGGEAGNFAVDRVLKKYKRAPILEDGGTADERYDVELKRRMDDWKREYYRVSFSTYLVDLVFNGYVKTGQIGNQV